MRKRRICLWVWLLGFGLPLLLPDPAAADERYRVRSGDSLYRIAKKYHVTVDSIRQANNLDGIDLRVNQVLVIPGGKPARKQAEKSTSKAKSGAEKDMYVVKQGDTLAGIAVKKGVSASEIRSLNGLESSRLKTGQRLVLERPAARAAEEEDDLEEAGSIEADELAMAREDAGKESIPAAPSLSRWNSSGERDLFVKVVKSYEGVPYKLGGNTMRGIDCSAFTRKVYGIYSIDLPRTAREQLQRGKRLARKDLDTGDLVFFKTRRSRIHVGIFLGGSEFFHLSSRNRAGKVDNIDSDYFISRFISGVRLTEGVTPAKADAQKGPGTTPALPAPALSPTAEAAHPPGG